ncbi:MAG TPA: DinB family protein [Planctomycetaceae bacterium]|nr:DinB family protein [Planctomycetaceae bacterium]
MSAIDVYMQVMDQNRMRTLATLDEVAKQADPAAVLGWRPGSGRAHIAWQLMHIGITEELFGTERLIGRPPAYADLVPRFKGGSTPDDNIPSVATIREVLEQSRVHLKAALGQFSDNDLDTIPEWFKERGWNLARVLQVICWHEGHHQGQAHITLNLWKNK